MERVAIIGCGGAGKSTLARALGERTGLPVVHLDTHYWQRGWTPLPDDTWAAEVERLAGAPRWIMDGHYGGTMERRLARADTIIFLDRPRWLCLARVVRRRMQYRGRVRPCMTPGCNERLSGEFLHYIWHYNATRRPKVLERIERHREGRRVAILRTSGDVHSFLGS